MKTINLKKKIVEKDKWEYIIQLKIMFSSVAQKSFSPKENLKHFLSSWGFQHALSDAQNNWTKVLGACHNNINLNRHPYLLNTDFRLSWLFSCFLQKLSLETVPYFFFYS